jgi:hypothetical protein
MPMPIAGMQNHDRKFRLTLDGEADKLQQIKDQGC